MYIIRTDEIAVEAGAGLKQAFLNLNGLTDCKPRNVDNGKYIPGRVNG